MNNVGFGDSNFTFAVYIENKPKVFEYEELSTIKPLCLGEINVINQSCGNGWRKVFNVYAKLLYALSQQRFNFSSKAPTWQEFRDGHLLQESSQTALLFSPPQLNSNQAPLNVKGQEHSLMNNELVHIISGRGYAQSLIKSGKIVVDLVWLDNEFAIDTNKRLIVCPYFDYRQLSNLKIERLSVLLLSLRSTAKPS